MLVSEGHTIDVGSRTIEVDAGYTIEVLPGGRLMMRNCRIVHDGPPGLTVRSEGGGGAVLLTPGQSITLNIGGAVEAGWMRAYEEEKT